MGPRFEFSNSVRRSVSFFNVADQSELGGVMKRTNHAGDIPQRWPLDPAFTERTGRFSFKVDDQKIFSGVENLSEMVIAMNADPHARDRGVGDQTELAEDLFFEIENAFGIFDFRFGKCFKLASEQLKSFDAEIPHRLIKGSLVKGCEWLGREVFVVGIGGEGEMQFAGPMAEKAAVFQKGAEKFESLFGEIFFEGSDQPAAGSFRHGRRFDQNRLNTFEIASERIERIFPGIAAVGDEFGKQSEADRWSAFRLQLERSGKRRHVPETFFGEKTDQFEVRIDARIEAAEKFQDETVAENNSGVALFSGADGRFERIGFAAEPTQNRRSGRMNFRRIAGKGPPARHSVEKCGAKISVSNGIVKDPRFVFGRNFDPDDRYVEQ